MQTKRNLFVFAAFIALAASDAGASGSDIIISEVQIGSNDGSSDDFVELYNPDDSKKDISGYRLRIINSTGKDNSLVQLPSGSIIPEKGYFLWARSDSAYADMSDAKTGNGLSEKYSLAFFPPKKSGDTIIDSVSWESAFPFGASYFNSPNSPGDGQSLIRDTTTLLWSVTDTPTPTNSKGILYTPRPYCVISPQSDTLRISEFLPHPKKDSEEFIELYNPGKDAVPLRGFTLKDKNDAYVFLETDEDIASHEYFALQDKISLNDDGDNRITLMDKSKVIVHEICYSKTKENVSLNYTPSGWRGGTPTPGTTNILNNLPTTKEKVPKKGFKGMPITMSAKGKDADRDKLKYTWDFGDGHKSYKQETSHTYEKNGEYVVTLTVSDGSDDTIETFTIKIVSYEPPDVRIVSFVPNPDGKDSDSEWILIENREKKKSADLKGFGIATGWKKLANHPIRESFIIPPKSSATLTRAYSLFTLPNQKGKIELRAPDGDVLQEIKYKLEKSAPEDAVYMKKKGERWKLTASQQKPKSNQSLTTNSQQETEDDQQSATNDQQETLDSEQLTTNSQQETRDSQQSTINSQPETTDEEKEIPKSETPAVIRNDEMTKDPDQPKLSDLLSYGLSLHLPKAVAYVPHDEVSVTPAAPEPKAEESSVDTLFVRVNTLINAWMNGV
jgi:PKD repeat protein